MSRFFKLSAVVLVVFCASNVMAQSFSYDVDADSVDSGLIDDRSFNLPAIASIKSIEVEIATTWGGDQEMTLTAPDGTVYVPMFDETDVSGSGNFDMGLAADDASLANVGNYVFLAPAGLPDYADDYAAPGSYDANTWGAGPHAAGLWNFFAE